jgi:hypothetical protein
MAVSGISAPNILGASQHAAQSLSQHKQGGRQASLTDIDVTGSSVASAPSATGKTGKTGNKIDITA